MHQKVEGSIPGQGVCGRQPISVSHIGVPRSLKSIIYPEVRIKKLLLKGFNLRSEITTFSRINKHFY